MDMRVRNADILIVDDEPTMTRALARMLELSGHHPRIANSGEEALDYIERHSFDLVLLDLRMPGMDGLEVLAAAQALAPGTTFVILTAHGSLDSAITAMRWGASDYLLKPCSVDEIVETVRRGLEKRWRVRQREQLVGLLQETLAVVNAEERTIPVTPESESGILKIGSMTLDPQWRSVAVNGKAVKLSATEYQILAHFARHVNQVVTCCELVRQTHGLDLNERDARPIIRMHIHRLRQKLESNPSQPHYLQTVRGVGYMLVADRHAQ